VHIRGHQETETVTAQVEDGLLVGAQRVADSEVADVRDRANRAAHRHGVRRGVEEVVQATALIGLEVGHDDVAQAPRIDHLPHRVANLLMQLPVAGLDQGGLLVVDDEHAYRYRRAWEVGVDPVYALSDFADRSHDPKATGRCPAGCMAIPRESQRRGGGMLPPSNGSGAYLAKIRCGSRYLD
jgi:hypothetical protein